MVVEVVGKTYAYLILITEPYPLLTSTGSDSTLDFTVYLFKEK
jgi:hypothetical protein